MKSILKVVAILVGATGLTALGIDAADTLSGSRSTLLGQLVGTVEVGCPVGMLELPAATSFTCVDAYEAAPSDGCEFSAVSSVIEVTTNLTNTECSANADENRLPWRFVSRDQAQTLCLRAGKRLPTNEEWQFFALGTAAEACNIESRELAKTGDRSDCVSAVGVYDAIGNVWEWTSDEVVAGTYAGRTLPATGYVTVADAAGIAVETGTTSSAQYGRDYFWSKLDGVAAIMRGGFYGSGDDAGVYAAHADVPPDLAGEAIGFRCVK